MERECIVQHIGTIEIENSLIVSDPCYGIQDKSCNAVELGENDINAGIYDCYVGWVRASYGCRVAFMVISLDGQQFSLPEILIGDVAVDSGTMMIGDFNEWRLHHNGLTAEDEWYDENIVNRPQSESVFDSGKTFLSSTGYGDGYYPVFAGKCKESEKFARVMVRFIKGYDEGYNILDFISSDEEPDFEAYD